MKKVLDIGCKIYKWILNPINILGLVLAPIYLGLCVAISKCGHKFRIWVNMTRVMLVAILKYIWMVFSFRWSGERYNEYKENAIGKAEEILKKYGEL